MLFAVAPRSARAARETLLVAAREAVRGSMVSAAFGPTVVDGIQAHWSYAEAQEVFRLGLPDGGRVLDAMDFLGRRILSKVPDPAFWDFYVHSSVGELLTWDRKHGTSLLTTLVCWLDSGCNTTGSAATLNIERQTMHKRLNKIQELLGGDPRTSGRLFDIHIAARAAAAGVSSALVGSA